MDFDDVLAMVGGWGKYQKRFYLMVSLPALFKGYQVMLVVFTAFVPKHRCAVPGLTNDTYKITSEQHRHLVMGAIPYGVKDGDVVFDQCSIYADVDDNYLNNYLNSTSDREFYSNTTHSSISSNNSSNSNGNRPTMSCNEWVYDSSEMKATVITRFNMVCQKKYLRAHSNMMMMAGFGCGSAIASVLCDWLGRKRVFCCCLMMMMAFGVASAFPSSPEMLLAFRFLSGTGLMGVMVTGFVIAVEIVGVNMRTRLGAAWQIVWLVGPFILAALSYGLRDWQLLQLAGSVPPLVFLSYWWLIPESPRWLVSRRRIDEAMVIMKAVAKVNKKTLPACVAGKLDEAAHSGANENVTASPLEIFKYPRFFVRFLIISFNWGVISMTYYGLSLNVSNLSGGIRVNFIVSCVVELIGYAAALLFLDIFGRKKVHVTSMMLAGVSCLLTIFTVLYAGNDYQWITTALASLGKLGVSSSFAVIFLYSAELYPTVLRNFGVGCGSIFARIGSLMSPYIADIAIYLEGGFSTAIPLLIFGSSAVAAGVLSLFLPETLHKKLPETIQDAVNFGSEKKETDQGREPPSDDDEAVPASRPLQKSSNGGNGVEMQQTATAVQA